MLKGKIKMNGKTPAIYANGIGRLKAVYLVSGTPEEIKAFEDARCAQLRKASPDDLAKDEETGSYLFRHNSTVGAVDMPKEISLQIGRTNDFVFVDTSAERLKFNARIGEEFIKAVAGSLADRAVNAGRRTTAAGTPWNAAEPEPAGAEAGAQQGGGQDDKILNSAKKMNLTGGGNEGLDDKK